MKHIAFILSRVPFPLEKGDKLRAYNQAKILNEHYKLHLCCLNFGKVNASFKGELEKICTSYTIIQLSFTDVIWSAINAIIGHKPWQVCYFEQNNAKRKVEHWIKGLDPDIIYAQLVRTAPYVPETFKGKAILDFQDAFSAGMRRRAERSPWYMRWFWDMEAKRLKDYETQLCSRFDMCTIISDQDKAAIENQSSKHLRVVPNGVDLGKFIPLRLPKTTDLLFTGNMSYPPNVESALYLANEILPLVRLAVPNIRLTICGTNPAPSILELSRRGIIVTGWVDDIARMYHSTKIFIAPMQMGAGLQNKLLEAIACGIPCITSQLAANAFPKALRDILWVGNSPADYAEKIVLLLRNEGTRNEMAQSARTFVMEHYTWEKASLPLLEALNQLD